MEDIQGISFPIVVAMLAAAMLVLCGYENANAQQLANLTSSTTNFTKLFEDKYKKQFQNTDPRVAASPKVTEYAKVNYESPTTILISGNLIIDDWLAFDSSVTRFNSILWEAMDLLKNQYGFKIQNMMTSGQGSVGNPTSVYILMTK